MDFSEALPAVPIKESDAEEDALIKAKADKDYEELIRQGRVSQAASIKEKAEIEINKIREKRALDSIRRDVELVTCGRKTRNGGTITTFHAGYRPNIRNHILVPECGTLFGLENDLILSESSRTRVFTFENNEIFECGSESPTIKFCHRF